MNRGEMQSAIVNMENLTGFHIFRMMALHSGVWYCGLLNKE